MFKSFKLIREEEKTKAKKPPVVKPPKPQDATDKPQTLRHIMLAKQDKRTELKHKDRTFPPKPAIRDATHTGPSGKFDEMVAMSSGGSSIAPISGPQANATDAATSAAYQRRKMFKTMLKRKKPK
jgi:hypothetical protein